MNWELLQGAQAIRESVAEWDDLWLRSETSLPTARALPVVLWHEQFMSHAPLKAIVVRDAGRLVAALPLVIRGRFPRVAHLPSNDWMPGGTMLVDRECDATTIARSLLDGLARLSCQGFWLRNIPWKSLAWQGLLAAGAERGLPILAHRLHEVGLTDLRRSWPQIEAAFSGNHRRHMRKALRRAEKEGGIEFQAIESFGPGELERLLRIGFEIETRSWKGKEQTTILQQPGYFEFKVRRAAEIARDGQVRLVFLYHQGTPIAFEYCWKAKGRLMTPKIAYDEAFSRLSPGQLLIHLHLQDLVQAGTLDEIDFLGPLTDSTRKWCTGAYEAGTIVLGQPGLVGKTVVSAYRLRRAWKERAAAKTVVAASTSASGDAAEEE